jgi:hypothetical protein
MGIKIRQPFATDNNNTFGFTRRAGEVMMGKTLHDSDPSTVIDSNGRHLIGWLTAGH